MRYYRVLVRSLLLAVVLAPCARAGDFAPPEVIGTLDGEPLRLEDVKARTAFQLYRLQTDMYMLLKQEAERIVDERLLAREAARRGITVEALLEAEVDAQVPPLPDDAMDRYLAEHPADAAKGARVRPRIAAYLAERAVIQRRLDFLKSLRDAAEFALYVEPPARPRMTLDLTDAPSRGAADAPITIVHFASFTCPRCAQSAHDIEQLMAEMPGRIRWVHRNFFNMYDERALRCAQVALAAQDAGRFWEYHDQVYATGGAITLDALAEIARDLGLTAALDDRERERSTLPRIKADIDAGVQAGVTSVPTLYVNGRYFSGTFGYAKLKALVEEELAGLPTGANPRR